MTNENTYILSDNQQCAHRLKNLPEADIVFTSGDFCMVGKSGAMDFL
ncbi:hypothetical protein [Paramuribaculum intestinale]